MTDRIERARALLDRIKPGLAGSIACGSCAAPVDGDHKLHGWACCDRCWSTPELVTHMHFPGAYVPHYSAVTGDSELYQVRQEQTQSWFNLDGRRAAFILGVPITGDSGQALLAAIDEFPGKLVWSDTGVEPGRSALYEEPFGWCLEGLRTAYDHALHQRTATKHCFENGAGCHVCGRREFPSSWTPEERLGRLWCQQCATVFDQLSAYGQAAQTSVLSERLSEELGFAVHANEWGIKPAGELGVTGKGPFEHVNFDVIRADRARVLAEEAAAAKPSALKVGR